MRKPSLKIASNTVFLFRLLLLSFILVACDKQQTASQVTPTTSHTTSPATAISKLIEPTVNIDERPAHTDLPLTPTALPTTPPSTAIPKPIEPTIYINEVLAHTDLPQVDSVELFNPSDYDQDISGWYLSDKSKQRDLYQIPTGTIVPAQGYLVIDERQFRQGDDGFGLSETGETVYLTSADATVDDEGNWSGYSVKAKFDASPNGVAFGRIGSDYVLLTEPTLGRKNAEPQIGPIVIVEIGVGRDAGAQYIVLENITNKPIGLYDPLIPENTWRIRKGFSYDFAPDIEIGPLERFVVAADPDEMRLLTALRVFGPVKGEMKHDNDNIAVLRPDKPNGSKVPYMTIDYVQYSAENAWPLATNSAVLARISAAAFGNTPENWALSKPFYLDE